MQASLNRSSSPGALTLRPARAADLPRLESIRDAAFAPVFASFRRLLGDELYELAGRRSKDSLWPAPEGGRQARSAVAL
jgi:hypothetical protein